MRFIIYLLFVSATAVCTSCSGTKSLQSSTAPPQGIELEAASNDSTEYELLIIDPGFEGWFMKHRKPKWYHTQEYLESKNIFYVTAWNNKVMDGTFQINTSDHPFENTIDYQHNVDYGLDLNYRLFYYFQYVEDTWGKFASLGR